MAIALILIGAILIVVAFQGTQAQLVAELQEDVPGYFVWAAAIAAIVGLGFVPGLQKPSRWLLGLVLLVIVLKNYKQIFGGLQSFALSGGAAPGSSATAAGSSGSSATATAAATVTTAALDPASYLGSLGVI